MRAVWRRTRLLGVAVATAAIVLVSAPTPAQAAMCISVPISGTITSGPSGTNPDWGDEYFGATTTYHYWSIVGARGSQGATVSTSLLSSPSLCSILETTDSDAAASRWVAFDNNVGRLPIGSYDAGFQGGKYIKQFVAGSRTLSTSSPTTDQSVGYGAGVNDNSWIVDIRDVYLTAGHTYTFIVTGGFSGLYLLHSDSDDASTWTAKKATAWAKVTLPDDDPNAPPGHSGEDIVRTATLTVHPIVSDWYGAVFSRNGWWGPAVTVRVSQS